MVEMQFGDFVSCGFNQIVNNLAKTHYRWGAPVPVVVRLPIGGGVRRGAVPLAERRELVHERRGPEGRRAGDAVRRQGAAARGLRGRQPRAVPRAQVALSLAKGRVPEGYYTRADRPGAACAREGTRRDGRHLRRRRRLGARGRRARWRPRGRAIEVIDLRSLLPWDREAVLASVRKTGRCLVLHEAPVTGGFGGEDRRRRRRARPSSGSTRRSSGSARSTRPSLQPSALEDDVLAEGAPAAGAPRPAGVLAVSYHRRRNDPMRTVTGRRAHPNPL